MNRSYAFCLCKIGICNIKLLIEVCFFISNFVSLYLQILPTMTSRVHTYGSLQVSVRHESRQDMSPM